MNFAKKHVDAAAPRNAKPLRFAFLGGARSGKTSVVSKLAWGMARDTYYPLLHTQPILFHFSPEGAQLKRILDQELPRETLAMAARSDSLVLSPVLYNCLVKNAQKKMAPVDDVVVCVNEAYANTRAPKGPNNTTPILVELVDTPAFNPTQIVPFLEASLYIKLDKDVLHGLADEPRRPVSTNPLLVASGASDLNGSLHGYFFVYSAVPLYDPPAYDQTYAPTSDASTLSLLPVMKDALDDAWREYYTYKTNWKQGKELDVFSLKATFKGMLSEDIRPVKSEGLMDTPVDPSDPYCPPPIWILCTNIALPLALPLLIDEGKKLSAQWKCGFVAVDLQHEVEQALALIVREHVERRALQKRKR